MNTYRSYSLNEFWIGIVLIHVIGSMGMVMLLSLSAGVLFLNSILWVYCAIANRHKRLGIFGSAVGWSLNLYLITHLPLNLSSALMMNILLFAFMFYLHFGSLELLLGNNRIGKIHGKDILYILILTLLLIIIGGYVNAVSMLAFSNHVLATLDKVGENLPGSILTLAIAPAVVEEIIYRGYVFQRLGNGKKAIFVSAILFAIGHMTFNQMCYAFVVGLFFAAIYHITGNLTYSMTIHFLYNMYSIMQAALKSFSPMQAFMQFKIAGYSLWNAILVNEDGKVMMNAAISGLIITMIALVLVIFVLAKLQGEKTHNSFIAESGKGRGLRIDFSSSHPGKDAAWRPDYLFWFACVLCILTAVSYDILPQIVR